jgi:CheY-like chemotaxis protein
MNVLIVDDDPEMRLMARFLLEQRGDNVYEAADAGMAAAVLAKQPVDLVLMDVMLGEEDGIDVAQRVIPKENAPLLIYLTAATRGDQLERMYATNMAGVILKPFDPESFVPTVERLVAGARG